MDKRWIPDERVARGEWSSFCFNFASGSGVLVCALAVTKANELHTPVMMVLQDDHMQSKLVFPRFSPY